MSKHRSRENRDKTEAGDLILGTAACLAAGAGLMYLLDPDAGTRRRAVARDKTVGAASGAGSGLASVGRSIGNHSKGLVAGAKARLSWEVVPNTKLAARVRSSLGRAIANPKAIGVAAQEGTITLTGNIYATELDGLLRTVGRVPGVRGVHNRVQPHDDHSGHPDLRPAGTRGARPRDSWPPPARFLATVGGGAMAVLGLVRRDGVGALVGAAGVCLAARAATDLPARRLLGIGAGRRAVEVRKSIHIKAPADLVFGFFANYEGFPMFMSNVRRVEDFGDGRSHWVVAGPGGINVEWDAILADYVPNELIAWESVDGALVKNEGVIEVRETPEGGALVDIYIAYNPPGGALGHALAMLFGADPKSEMDADLARVKNALETGNPPRDAADPVTVEDRA